MQARLCSVGGSFLSTSFLSSSRDVWIFGYGSLIWRPDFPFARRERARIEGWSRRFWQGSHDHRGTADAPGRVVTLVSDPDALCYGVAYLIDHAVFEHLDHREKNGYERNDVDLQFADARERGVVYIAHPGNQAFLGESAIESIARQILTSTGPSGTNREYLYELAAALRNLDADDPHVFELEAHVKMLEADGHSPAA
jgi:glutathione-specific gamma-glutamylcyclotransferase